jgi:hypothetical protein
MKQPELAAWDLHFMFHAGSHILKCFDAEGVLRWQVRAIGYGTVADYAKIGGNTPPGLYRCSGPQEIGPDDPDKDRYGPWFVDLVEQEEQESKHGRAGIGVHGGGTGLTKEDPYTSKRQGWLKTLGCVRLQNEDLRRFVASVSYTQHHGGSAWFSVSW